MRWSLLIPFLLGACGGGDDPGQKVRTLADRVCACAEPACAVEAGAELERVSREVLAGRADRDLALAIAAANARALQCTTGAGE